MQIVPVFWGEHTEGMWMEMEVGGEGESEGGRHVGSMGGVWKGVCMIRVHTCVQALKSQWVSQVSQDTVEKYSEHPDF